MEKSLQQTLPRETRARGFTLIELLVVVAILAIILFVGVPGLTDMSERGQVRGQVGKLRSALEFGRSEAVARRMPVVVCGSDDGNGCNGSSDWSRGWYMYLDRDGNSQPDIGSGGCGNNEDCLLAVEQTAQNLITMKITGGLPIVFDKDGSASSAGAGYDIHICPSTLKENSINDSTLLRVSITGAVKVERGTATCP